MSVVEYRYAGTDMRGMLIAIGWCAVGLAGVGAVVPGMPTTVFLLIAFYCFARSSPALAQWLQQHPTLGPSLRRHLAEGGMSRRAKRAALVAMWTSIAISSALLFAVSRRAALVTIGLGVVGTGTILLWVRTTATAADDARTLPEPVDAPRRIDAARERL